MLKREGDWGVGIGHQPRQTGGNMGDRQKRVEHRARCAKAGRDNRTLSTRPSAVLVARLGPVVGQLAGSRWLERAAGVYSVATLTSLSWRYTS